MQAAAAPLTDVPYCVVDLETTGLSPGLDRVVELSVVRVEPGGAPRLVLDTLIHPDRPMAGTEVHGISEADVDAAPPFARIGEELLEAIDGAVLVAYNASFDLRFVRYELRRLGIELRAPHLCAMYFRPLLSLGQKCTLSDACQAHDIVHAGVHSAAGDATATATLLGHYLDEAQKQGVVTLGDLRGLPRHYKFLDSLDEPLPTFGPATTVAAKVSRSIEPDPIADDWRIREYQDVVLVALDDLVVTDEELEQATAAASRLGLSTAQVRAVHARVFASTLNEWAADDAIDEDEVARLVAMRTGLARLGWAPGEGG